MKQMNLPFRRCGILAARIGVNIHWTVPIPHRRLMAISGAVLGLLIALGWWWQPFSAAQAGTCTNGAAISETLSTGARWDLCWAERTSEGIVLSEIFYTPPGGVQRKVLREASLSQIEVHYDDGLAMFTQTDAPGLGGNQLLTLAAADCPDGTLLSNGERNVLCQQVGPRGYLYKYYTVQRQGDALTLFSASAIGQRTYIVQWRFFDDGTIEPQVGEAGRLLRLGQDPQSGWPVDVDERVGIGYVTNYWWRLDFDLGGNGSNDYVDEFNVESVNSNTQLVSSATQLEAEAGRSTDPNVKRSWRVRDGVLTNADGHAISYHLEPKQTGYRYAGPETEPWSQHDLYATVAHVCERLAVANVTEPPCGAHVAAFVNGESLAGADVVLWYRVTAHRLPRAEDTPLLGLQWHGYQLLPRDWTAQNPF